MTNYIIGPWCGEFGSEVLDFIPYIRTIRKDYLKNNHVIAYCSPGKELLYEFVDEYWIFPDTFTPKINSREFYTKWGTLVNSQTSYHLTYKDAPVSDVFTQLESNITEKLAGQDVVCIVPFYNLAEYSGVNLRYYSIHKPLNWTGISMLQTQQDILCPFLSSSIIPTHVALRTQINNTPKVEKLIALFPRNKLCEPWRNWPGEHWKKLAEILLSIGYSVAIFGSGKGDSSDFIINSPYFFNTIGTDIKTQVSYLQQAILAVSACSGSQWLSIYAGVPTAIFFPGEFYHALSQVRPGQGPQWNPLGIPVYYLDTGNQWDINPDRVKDFIINCLEK